jgi:hypothetical protein
MNNGIELQNLRKESGMVTAQHILMEKYILMEFARLNLMVLDKYI